jgi:ubiquinone/menaquinone biosynthesis C-methylase UbiE
MRGTDRSRSYAIHGGKQGKERLDVLARTLLPTTAHLLARVGLGRGMRALDVGCGGGHVTILMATMVGPQGRVIGTDSDAEVLALATQDAEVAKLTNIKFEQLDACTCVAQQQFDVAYARFLLSHLGKPESCLTEMAKACVPGGTVVIEDTDFEGSFCYPSCAAYDRYKELYQSLIHRRGGDSNVGRKLPTMLRTAGLKSIAFEVIQPAHIRGEGKLMAPLTMSRISDALIAENLATENDVQRILRELNRIAADSETLVSLPRIFQVWGKRTG